MAIKGKLRNVNNLGIVDEQQLLLFIPEPGYACLNQHDAPANFKERIDLVNELIEFWNDNHRSSKEVD